MFRLYHLVLLSTTLFVLGCEQEKAPELIGTWDADTDLTESLAENQSVDQEHVRLVAWVYGIDRKDRIKFLPNDRFLTDSGGYSSEFKYEVVGRTGKRLTLRAQIVVDPSLVKSAKKGAFDPFESIWLILGEDRIANLHKSNRGECWVVYRRVREASKPNRETVIDEKWERMKRAALDDPPIEWTCNMTGLDAQKAALRTWRRDTSGLVPEVAPTIEAFLGSAETKLDQVITNKPTGAQYRITGQKTIRGVNCSVKFVGNINWK